MVGGLVPLNRRRSIYSIVELLPVCRIEMAFVGLFVRKITIRPPFDCSVSICTALRPVSWDSRTSPWEEWRSVNIRVSIRRESSTHYRYLPEGLFARLRAMPELLTKLGDAPRGFADHFASYRTSPQAKRKPREADGNAPHYAG